MLGLVSQSMGEPIRKGPHSALPVSLALMSSLVVGAKRSEQVADAVAAADLEIPCEHFARIDEIVPAPWKQDDPIR